MILKSNVILYFFYYGERARLALHYFAFLVPILIFNCKVLIIVFAKIILGIFIWYPT